MFVSRTSGVLAGLAAAAVITGACWLFDNEKTQGIYLVVPFLSGAANWELGEPWRYAEADTIRLTEMSPAEREDVRLERSDDLVPYSAQSPGYVYVALISRNLFFWMGDLAAVEALQILVHVLISLFFLVRFRTPLEKALFFFLYAVNPLVIYVTTFPYYYFWQVVPSAALLAYLADREWRYGWFAPAVVLLLGCIHMVRPTMVFVTAMVGLFILLRESRPVAVASCVVALVMGAWMLSVRPEQAMNPWHTAYTGIAAWPNPYVKELSDQSGLVLYEQAYGEKMRFGVGENNSDPEVMQRYRKVTRAAYMEVAKARPDLLVRNAVLNVLGSFSIGYVTASLNLSYLSAAIGLAYLSLLLWARRFVWVAAILASSVSFSLYFPPVPVYLFGAYILSIGAFVSLFREPEVQARLEAMLPFRLSGGAVT
jgi:hypothetical protein